MTPSNMLPEPSVQGESSKDPETQSLAWEGEEASRSGKWRGNQRVVDAWLTATVETSLQLLGLPVAHVALLDLQETDKLVGEDDARDTSPGDVEGLVLLKEPGEGEPDLGRAMPGPERGDEP